MNLPLKLIAEWVGAPYDGDARASGYSIDTRTLLPGDLFFALKGESSDGHDWVVRALSMGAAAAVVRRDWQGEAPGALLRVDDPGRALQSAAGQARVRWGGKVVAITGSNGKTTTKDVLAALLETRWRVSKTVGNLNNELACR